MTLRPAICDKARKKQLGKFPSFSCMISIRQYPGSKCIVVADPAGGGGQGDQRDPGPVILCAKRMLCNNSGLLRAIVIKRSYCWW